jgi:DNA-binding IscR family transcriptional regulator
MAVGCTLRDVWQEIRDATISLLGNVTFAELAERAGGPWVEPSLLSTGLQEVPTASN